MPNTPTNKRLDLTLEDRPTLHGRTLHPGAPKLLAAKADTLACAGRGFGLDKGAARCESAPGAPPNRRAADPKMPREETA